MIVDSHTVIDPGAMMVKPFNAFVADTAMSRTVCSNNFTICAQEHRVEDLHHFHEGDAFGAFEESGVFAHGPHVQGARETKHDQLDVDLHISVIVEWE